MSIQRTAPTQEQIAARAYTIWEKEGYPQGREQQHWQEAERQLRTEHSQPPVPASTGSRVSAASRTLVQKTRFRAPKNSILQP